MFVTFFQKYVVPRAILWSPSVLWSSLAGFARGAESRPRKHNLPIGKPVVFWGVDKIEIIVFLIALLARFLALFLAIFYQGEQVLYLSDSSGFTNLAHSIVSGTGFSRDGGLTPHVLFMPGYPFFLAVSFYFFGSFWPALITQMILSSFTPVIIFRIGRILGLPSRVTSVSVWLCALEPHLVIFSVVYMTEALYGFLFTASILFFVRFVKNGFSADLFLSSVILGLSAYVKVSNYLSLLFIVALVFYLFLLKSGAKKIFASAAVFFIVFLAIVFPWFLRNFRQSGLWRFSSHEAYNLYVYDGASIMSLRDGINYEQGKKVRLDEWKKETGTDAGDVSSNLKLAELMQKRGTEFIMQNLGSSVKLAALTFISFWTSHNYSYFLTYFFNVFNKPLYNIPPTQLLFQGRISDAFGGTLKFVATPYYFVSLVGKILRLILAMLSVGGIWTLYKSGDYSRKSFAVLTGLIFVYFSVMAFGAGFGIEGRVRYPIEPLILLMAVVGASKFFSKIDRPITEKIQIRHSERSEESGV